MSCPECKSFQTKIVKQSKICLLHWKCRVCNHIWKTKLRSID